MTCLNCNKETHRKKFCSADCGMQWHNAKRKVALGWIRNPQIKKFFCLWCEIELSGHRRKFCCGEHGAFWNKKNNPNFKLTRKAAVKKYKKKNSKVIRQKSLKRKWIKRAGVNNFFEFQKLELEKEKTCDVCQKKFHSEWSDKKYCSKKCARKNAEKKSFEKHGSKYIKFKLLPASHHLKIRHYAQISISSAIHRRNAVKCSKTTNLIGCSIQDLKKHLESKFKDGMNWENHKRNGWHIDHIKPCAAFDLTNADEQKKCFHYTNLQPLWRDENIRKSNKWIKLPVRPVMLNPITE